MTATEATEQQQAKRDEQDDRPPRRRLQLALLLATLAAGAALVALVPALRHAVTLCLNGDFAGLRDYIRGLEAGGVLLLLALMLVHAVIFYPTELVTATCRVRLRLAPRARAVPRRVDPVGARLLRDRSPGR